MDIVKIRKKAKELQQKKGSSALEESAPAKEVLPQIVEAPQNPPETLAPSERKEVTPVETQEGVMIQQMPEESVEEIFDESSLVIDVPQIEVLEFVLGDEEYGVNLEEVREIIRMKPITEIPRSPAFVKGILSLRGTMIPVIDLKMRLKLGETEITPATRIIITADETRYFGVIVDRINGVVKIREDMIEPTPPTISVDVAEFIKGLGKYENKMVRLLDLHKVSQF